MLDRGVNVRGVIASELERGRVVPRGVCSGGAEDPRTRPPTSPGLGLWLTLLLPRRCPRLVRHEAPCMVPGMGTGEDGSGSDDSRPCADADAGGGGADTDADADAESAASRVDLRAW